MQAAARFSRTRFLPHRLVAARFVPLGKRALTTSSRPLASRHYVDAFYKETKDPVWLLLDALKSPTGRLHIEGALIESRIDDAEFSTWKPTIDHHDIQMAVSYLVEKGYDIPHDPAAAVVSLPPIPDWVVLYLVLYKVRTAAQAAGPLLDLVNYHIRATPAHTHGPLLVVAAYNLARYNLLVPLESLVSTFLNTPIASAEQESTFNIFLEALASAPQRSAASAKLVVRVLAAMDGRQLTLRPSTYRALLADRFVTLQLTKHLLARMGRDGVVPTAEHLEGFLRVFARDGAIHEARKYFAAIHAITTDPPPEEEGHDPRFAANTIMLGAHEDKASAFAFLRRLAQLSSENPPPPTASPAAPSTVQKIRFVSRPAENVYDQTTALHIAARDLRTSTHRLILSFLRMSTRPTVATHTVLIRGLLFRKEFTKAAVFWTRLERECLRGTGVRPIAAEWVVDEHNGPEYETPAWAHTGERRMVMDNAALTSGIQALIRCGRAPTALRVLERWAWRPSIDSPVGKDIGPPRVRLTTISVNELLVSFRRAARPDAVFALWDALPRYGVLPDTVSVSILLQAARLANTLDDSVSGAFARAKARVQGVLGSRPPHSGLGFDGVGGDADTDAAFAHLEKLLGTPNHPRPYAPGTWRGLPPMEAARWVFLQALFGMDNKRVLDTVEAPAAAAPTSRDGGPSPTALLRAPPRYVLSVPKGIMLRRPNGSPWYPSIALNNVAVLHYVTLLGLGGRADEIALVLAWTRALGLQPSDSTLAIALVFWAEVAVQAPLVEMMGARGKRGAESDGPGEYGRLVGWIRGWVGGSRVPDARALAKWRGVVQSMRTAGRSQ